VDPTTKDEKPPSPLRSCQKKMGELPLVEIGFPVYDLKVL